MNEIDKIVYTLTASLNAPIPSRFGLQDLSGVTWGIPTVISGAYSSGKTSLVNYVARASNMPFFGTKMSNKVLEHGIGLPAPDGKGNVHMVCIFRPAIEALQHDRCVILLDEMNTGAKALQSVFQGIFDEREVADMKFGRGARIVSCINPHNTGMQHTNKLYSTIVTRNLFITMDGPDEHDYVRETEFGDLPPVIDFANAEQKVIAGWAAMWPLVNTTLNHFITTTPTFGARHNGAEVTIRSMPQRGEYPLDGPAPCARSWTWLKSAITTRRILGLPQDIDHVLAEGLVGTPLANLLAPFLAASEVSVDEILDNPGLYTPKSPSEARYRVATCANYLKLNGPRRDDVWKYIAHCVDKGFLDGILNNVRDLVRHNYNNNTDGSKNAGATALIDLLITQGYEGLV